MGNPKPMQNLNLNPNQNNQMISTEPIEPNIVVVMRGGVVRGADQNIQHGQPQVRPEALMKVSFDVKKTIGDNR